MCSNMLQLPKMRLHPDEEIVNAFLTDTETVQYERSGDRSIRFALCYNLVIIKWIA